MQFNVSPGKRMLMFILIAFLCFLIGSVAVAFITYGGMTAPRLRIAAVVQDVVMFIAPPLLTAVVITRRPADFLQLREPPRLMPVLLVVAVAFASVPAMNSIVKWNESLTLPESMSALQHWMELSEEAARRFTDTLLGSTGISGLVMSVLIVGVFAGFSEELFFRGGLQRLLTTSGMDKHAAVWLTAFIFSAIHMQFFGFVPRLLLGAYFGYLLVWSRSLWMPIIAHFLNNTLAAVATHYEHSAGVDLNTIGAGGTGSDKIMGAVSAVLTAVLILWLYRLFESRRERIS